MLRNSFTLQEPHFSREIGMGKQSLKAKKEIFRKQKPRKRHPISRKEGQLTRKWSMRIWERLKRRISQTSKRVKIRIEITS